MFIHVRDGAVLPSFTAGMPPTCPMKDIHSYLMCVCLFVCVCVCVRVCVCVCVCLCVCV